MATKTPSPSSFRWAPHFSDPDLERFSRLTFDGIKDLNAALKALNKNAVGTQNQTLQNAQLIASLSAQIQNITQQITNITNVTNNFTSVGLDCGTFSGF